MADPHRFASRVPWKRDNFNALMKYFKPKEKVKEKDRIKAWNIHVGDEVGILAGDDKGKKGKVTEVDRKRNLVFVEGKKLIHKYIPKYPGMPDGGIFKMESGIAYSNVLLLDPVDGYIKSNVVDHARSN